MPPFKGAPSRQQQVVLALTPKITGSLSLLGSSYILYDCLVQTPTAKRHTYHRLLVGLSVADILMTTGLFMSTWPMPADTENVAFAVGTVHTCAVVGFLETAGVTAVLYNASLSVYYLLRIKHGWTASQIQQLAELYLHLVPILFGLATMIASASMQLFNAGLWDCWIYPYPIGCVESWQMKDNTPSSDYCQRGDNATLYQWTFDVIPKWSAVMLVTVLMVRIHRSVWRQEQSTHSFALRRVHLARSLARQSYLYVGALYVTYLPVVMTRLTEVLTGYVYYGMIVTISVTIPLQGLWNFLVFLRPRYLQRRRVLLAQQQATGGSSTNASPLWGYRFRAMSQAVQQGAGVPEEDPEGDDQDDGGAAGEIKTDQKPSNSSQSTAIP